MNKLFSLACLILLTLISCEDKSDSKLDLLEGTWKNTESDFPTISFYKDGKYLNTDLIQVPLPISFTNNAIPRKVTISGNFNLKNNKIEFITSNVEGTNDSNEQIIGNADGVVVRSEQPEITPNNNPRIWKIISLTDNQLKVKYILDTLTFERP